MPRYALLLPLALQMACAPHVTAPDAPWRGKTGVELDLGPYIVALDDGRFAIVVDDPALKQPPRLSWWIGRDSDRREVIASRRDDLWVAVLAPPPGARVHYRVQAGGRSVGPFAFKAGERRGSSFRFVVYGDTRTRHIVNWEVIKGLSNERIDFAVHTGDLVSFGVQEREWRRFFAIQRPLMVKAPLFPMMGNHDASKLGHFRRFFIAELASGGRRYYARDWGDLRLVVMDDEEEYREGSAQYRFIDGKLAEAASREMLIVLAMHEPPYSSGDHGSNLTMRRTIEPLARRYGVELVVSGHDHNYERVKAIHGVTYVVTGSAGAPIHPVHPQSFTAAVRLEPHYVIVDVEKRGLTLRAINLKGHTFDSHVIPPNPPLNPVAAGR